MNNERGESLLVKQSVIKKIADVAKTTSDPNVKIAAIQSLEKIAVKGSDEKKSYVSRFFEPIALSLISNLLWENGIKKVAAWIAATLFRANVVFVPVLIHVALKTLLA